MSARRILLKISGELFQSADGGPFDFKKYQKLAQVLGEFVKKYQVELAVVVGAGNLWRYRDTKDSKLSRVKADKLGMLATNFNAKILEESLNGLGVPAKALTALEAPEVLPTYSVEEALGALGAGEVVILAGGTGNPYFTTDSCAVLRALELECELLLKATMVDGVYSADPRVNSGATRYERISYDLILKESLGVMDLSAIALARDNDLSLLVFDFTDFGNLEKVYLDNSLGTLVESSVV